MRAIPNRLAGRSNRAGSERRRWERDDDALLDGGGGAKRGRDRRNSAGQERARGVREEAVERVTRRPVVSNAAAPEEAGITGYVAVDVDLARTATNNGETALPRDDDDDRPRRILVRRHRRCTESDGVCLDRGV